MISRLLTVGVVALTMLTAGSVCLAQEAEPDSGATPGRGAVGGLIGASSFFADADYSEQAQPRFAFAGTFRYVVNDWLRWQVSPGYSWTAYKKTTSAPFPDPNFPADTLKDEHITQVVPITFQLQYLVRRAKWMYHVGVGPGLYRVWVENRRKVLKDPVTLKLHRDLYWGVSGQVGVERFLTPLPNTSIEVSLAVHWAFAQDDEKFVSGYNSFLASMEGRIGANYYFDLRGDKPLTELPPTAEP